MTSVCVENYNAASKPPLSTACYIRFVLGPFWLSIPQGHCLVRLKLFCKWLRDSQQLIGQVAFLVDPGGSQGLLYKHHRFSLINLLSPSPSSSHGFTAKPKRLEMVLSIIK